MSPEIFENACPHCGEADPFQCHCPADGPFCSAVDGSDLDYPGIAGRLPVIVIAIESDFEFETATVVAPNGKRYQVPAGLLYTEV